MPPRADHAVTAPTHPLHVVPLRVNLDGRDFLDKTGLDTSAFYRRMAASHDLPRNSQPPPGDFRRIFEFLRAHHHDVVYVGLSRAVSGTLQSAEQAAGRVEGGGVHVFDTVNAAGGQALRASPERAPRWRAIVGHCDAAADGQRTLEVLRRRLDLVASHLVETGPAVGAHAGRGALVVALQPAPDDPR